MRDVGTNVECGIIANSGALDYGRATGRNGKKIRDFLGRK